MFFDDSRPDRRKRAKNPQRIFERSPIPPAKSYELLTYNDIINGGFRTLIFDVESYPNYFLVAFKDIENSKVIYFEDSPDAQIDCQLLSYILHRFKLIGFNSKVYDLPMIAEALTGSSANYLFDKSMEIISKDKPEFDLRLVKVNHIDLIEVAPLEASLKLYAGRLHAPRMQDLPFQVGTFLSQEQAAIVRDYCINDLDNTQLLFEHLSPHIELREVLGREYNQDLRSKSDAQVAEAVISDELNKIKSSFTLVPKTKYEPGWRFHYTSPDNIKFINPRLWDTLTVIKNATFELDDYGRALTPKSIESLSIPIGINTYKLGNGGLHSQEKSISWYAKDGLFLIDKDVGSYYPAIVLNQNLYPEHIGEYFIEVYRRLVNRRLLAKKEGRKAEADALKIAVNGIFGKFGNQYSKVYAPDLVTQITISGQLYLLMLIDRLENAGISVISANTDGILIQCSEDQIEKLNYEVIAWEETTGFFTEELRYRSVHFRDVNNYIAIKEDGSCKTKGVYSEFGSALNSVLSKNPESLIISDAVQAFLAKGISLEETIKSSKDIRRFVNVRTVKGGAEKDSIYLGKAIRWYYAKGEMGEINYVLSGNKVPKTLGAKPLMILPNELPHDLDFDYYISEALNTLTDIGYYTKARIGKLL